MSFSLLNIFLSSLPYLSMIDAPTPTTQPFCTSLSVVAGNMTDTMQQAASGGGVRGCLTETSAVAGVVEAPCKTGVATTLLLQEEAAGAGWQMAGMS